MSVVDNWLLITSEWLEEDGGGVTLRALNARLIEAQPYAVGDGFKPLSDHAGGPKVMEAHVYGLATNHVDADALTDTVAKFFAETKDSGEFVLLVQRDQSESIWFNTVAARGGTAPVPTFPAREGGIGSSECYVCRGERTCIRLCTGGAEHVRDYCSICLHMFADAIMSAERFGRDGN